MKLYLVQEVEADDPFSASAVISADNEDDVKEVYENEFGEQYWDTLSITHIGESLSDESKLY